MLGFGLVVFGVVSNFYPQRYCYLASLVQSGRTCEGFPRFAVLWLGIVCVSRVGLCAATYSLSPLTYATPYARLGVRVCDLQDTPTLHHERNSVPLAAFVILGL